LDTFNYSNRTAVLKFLEKEYPSRSPEEADEFLHFRGITGGLDLRKAGDATPTKFSALLQEHDSDQFVRLDLEVEAAEPHHITRLDFGSAARPAEFAIRRRPRSQWWSEDLSRIRVRVRCAVEHRRRILQDLVIHSESSASWQSRA